MTKKNILILKFPYSSLFGGGEQHTLDLVERLQQKQWQFYLLSSCKVLLGEFKKRGWQARFLWGGKEPVSKITILFFPLLAPFILLQMLVFVMYYRLFRRAKILYCLSLTEKILITPFAFALGMRVIWMEHVGAGRWLHLNPYRFLYVWWSKLACVVTVSQHSRQSFLDIGIPTSRIKVIYNGVDMEKWGGIETRVADPTKAYVIGFIGRLVKEKGVDILLKAARDVRDILPQLRLLIIGSGPERGSLEWLTRKLELTEQVRFVGFQPELEKWIQHLHVLVLPSTGRESFGTILAYGLASGVPVVGSNLDGIPEIIDHGKTGYLVTPGSVQELADTLIHIFHHYNEALALARAGRAKVTEHFTLERMASEFETLFS
ncbi:MAG: hypothetical protein A3F54_00410 [Candidatus Kerfeldbacteria bacterium RIFCSPHIGHO2_12_FULL_48_17]|uniref:Glycosyl transferase family 1 domain-containing protein n=1 Tax=Candidatus Kerfeldbacteria bacterium RIFCSPHIGHO2_12_FULL_48_17 TaxID=1798542 RepID=A0A1G2B6L2_9BACT|nr:MAG: hypothetical protein A3F54_00410 [Candidatus Kerfeldbacteria bacterium RIFCSPHIGHO2_12_FULL_48_17]